MTVKEGRITDSAQDTILKWMLDGDTKEQAIYRWESITRTRLPDVIKNSIGNLFIH